MKHLKIIFVCAIILLLTGCWNYKSLEELAIVGAIGIDVEGDNFNVSVEVVNPKKAGGSSSSGGNTPEETDIVIYKAKAKTIKEAINKMVLESPKSLYVGHVNLLVIGEDAAKKGIRDFMDYFMRDTESRKIFTTVVVKDGKAIDALRILQPLETITSANIQSSFEATSKSFGVVSNMAFDEIMMCLYTPGRHPTIAAVKVYGSPEEGSKNSNLSTTQPKTTVKIVGAGVMKNDKLVGYLTETEGLYYSLARGKTKTISLSFPCDDKGNFGNVTMDNIQSSSKVEVKDGIPKATINVAGKAALTEYNCDTNLRDPKNITKMENMINKEISKNIKRTIEKVQGYDSDILGFGEQLYRNNNKYWQKNKDKWDDIFKTISYNIKSKIGVERMSSTVDAAKSR